jgi:hypothetical protein
MSANPTFQHRHYKEIAALLAANTPPIENTGFQTWMTLRNEFCNLFARDNGNFRRERFLAACAGTPSNGRDRVR